jgi:hypothetical protein
MNLNFRDIASHCSILSLLHLKFDYPFKKI